MYLPFVPVFLTSQLVIAAVDGVPTIDIQGTCRAAAAVTQGTSTQTDIDICVSSEQKARDQLVKDWAQYAAADKSRCVQAGPKEIVTSFSVALPSRAVRSCRSTFTSILTAGGR